MIERLKNSVEKKFGKKITSQKDCKILSNCILETSGEYISPATLRRVFGFLQTNSNPSRVTHNILCRYIGSKDWEHFIENNHEIGGNQNQIIEVWSRILEKSNRISNNTLDNIKRKSGINFNKTVNRQFADERFTFFLKSNYSSTALIGPGGYGKSTVLANWYEKISTKKTFSNDIILFLQAISLQSFASSEAYFEDWLMRQFGISPDNNFLRDILTHKTNPPGRFILIIDALDESNFQGSKLEKVYTSIADFSMKFSSTNWLKVIISSRLHEWTKFKPFIENNKKWYYTETETFSTDGANMPLLTSHEIQKIIDNTINTKFPKRTLVEEFSMELKETLSYPYFLQLFINVFHPENEYLLNDQIEIFREFLNKQIYNAHHSEEKIDLINKILELSDYGLKPDNVKKNTLKEIYPIHLKLAGNYFAAYEDLISFGILIEDDVENKFGGYIKTIRIANRNLFEILIAKNYLEKEENISFKLFNSVVKKYDGHELLPQLITRLYQFAYKDRILDPLKKFFSLDATTLNCILTSPRIAITLRKDEYLRKVLMPIYTNNPIARKYLFVDYPDINNITGSFSSSLDYYLKQCITYEDESVANILNIYAGFLSLNDGRIERFFSRMNQFVPNTNYNPSIIGIWFACKFLYNKMLKNQNADKEINEAISFLNELRSLKEYKYGLFETYLYSALIISNQYELLTKLIKEDEVFENSSLKNTCKELKIYRFFSELNSGKQLDLKNVIEIDLILSQLNPMDSHIHQILGQVLKATYYINNNEMTKAYECFRSSTELCNFAGYRIVEVKLMKNLSNALLRLGEKTKSIECNIFAERLTHKTGFKFELI
jgi:hypothetical protein